MKKILIKLYRSILGLDWELLSRESNAVYVNGKQLGIEFHSVYKHKVSGKIKYRWTPAA